MKVQYEAVKVQQEFESLALIVSQALGGKPKNTAKAVESFDELAAAFAAMGGKVVGR